jgi:transcriptional repressor NrdR
MKCPYCHREDTQVTDSRLTPDGQAVKRRRRCRQCGKRFTTYERVERIGLTVVKRDNTREEYSRDKLNKSIAVAVTKRPIPADQLEEAVNEIEAELFRSGASEVTSTMIGEMVMQKLRALDEVAYIRFASVYRNFADLEEMREAMEGLTGSPPAAEPARPEFDREATGTKDKARG